MPGNRADIARWIQDAAGKLHPCSRLAQAVRLILVPRSPAWQRSLLFPRTLPTDPMGLIEVTLPCEHTRRKSRPHPSCNSVIRGHS